MSDSAVIQLVRAVEATQIPNGKKVTLPEGAAVVITQSLGGTYTVLWQGQAGLFRIENPDADALGKAGETVVPTPAPTTSSAPPEEAAIWEQLKTCYDPEIPVNIVDLGLIYSLEIKGSRVEAKMTLTAVGCGMGPVIANDAKQKILQVPGVSEADVEVVWDPPWSPDRISQAGKEKLGMV
jgi:probable FeS assembly SUF system protein SufT